MVFADGVPMLRLPVGEGHEVSADPDMHEIIDGHLYTVFCILFQRIYIHTKVLPCHASLRIGRCRAETSLR